MFHLPGHIDRAANTMAHIADRCRFSLKRHRQKMMRVKNTKTWRIFLAEELRHLLFMENNTEGIGVETLDSQSLRRARADTCRAADTLIFKQYQLVSDNMKSIFRAEIDTDVTVVIVVVISYTVRAAVRKKVRQLCKTICRHSLLPPSTHHNLQSETQQ